MIRVREENPEDHDQIRYVNDLAFKCPDEGRIVDQIRAKQKEIISLVALIDEKIVGHILFSPVVINCDQKSIKGMGLAPMAVLPEYQKQGIGTTMVKEGLRKLQERKYPFVIVVGHAEYYPRFGFERASKYGLKCQWESVPDEAFMVMIMNQSVMKDAKGVAKYMKEFDAAM
jgi:putative acetyltransferase